MCHQNLQNDVSFKIMDLIRVLSTPNSKTDLIETAPHYKKDCSNPCLSMLITKLKKRAHFSHPVFYDVHKIIYQMDVILVFWLIFLSVSLVPTKIVKYQIVQTIHPRTTPIIRHYYSYRGDCNRFRMNVELINTNILLFPVLESTRKTLTT